MPYTDRDLKFTVDGDFELDENGDLALSTNYDCTVDDLNIIVKTHNLDTEFFKGAGLEDLEGLPATKEHAEQGRQMILDAIIGNSIAKREDVEILVFPVEGKILYHIIISTDNKELNYTLVSDEL